MNQGLTDWLTDWLTVTRQENDVIQELETKFLQ